LFLPIIEDTDDAGGKKKINVLPHSLRGSRHTTFQTRAHAPREAFFLQIFSVIMERVEARELRKNFLSFFEARGHAIVPSSSLIPDDPSVLLTTAGMQQFKPYYLGELDPLSAIHPNLGRALGAKNAASIQKSFRTSDIEEVGDDSHLTFFEMMGNFSFGGYAKKEAISYAHDFLTKELGLEISFTTIFGGYSAVPKDEESRRAWQRLGIVDIREEGMEDNFWGPTGTSGPCGPTTEVYCKNAAGSAVEIWNIVFNEFYFPGSREEFLSGSSTKKLERIGTMGVDTGMGLERLAMISQNSRTIFDTDLFRPFLELLPPSVPERERRILADHLRGIAFLVADGVRPSNKGAGYVLRRLMRRILVPEERQKIPVHVFDAILHDVVHEYGEFYPELLRENESIRGEFENERGRLKKTLEGGLKNFERLWARGHFSGRDGYYLHETFGFPFIVTEDLIRDRDNDFNFEKFKGEYNQAVIAHKEVSRVGQERKFGGHGLILDTGEIKAADEEELKIVTRLHTATHLLQAALRKVFGPEVTQQGSDITAVRTRFDFSFPRKMTTEEIQKIEDLVNEAIRRDLRMEPREMSYGEAVSSGALHFFRHKYPARVKVYTAYDTKTGEEFSKEFCGGPHVSHTGEIGRFRIVKEEASGAGVRRIRAVVE
jgi:alanyl-tRNA synthetase